MLVALIKKNNILKLLGQRGWSVYRLAKEVDMEYKSVHTLVNTETIPPQTHYATVRKIADALGVPVEKLEVEEEV